jgi:hypothetical protein
VGIELSLDAVVRPNQRVASTKPSHFVRSG